MERVCPVPQSAKSPPVNASGIVKITMNGDNRLWNCATMII